MKFHLSLFVFRIIYLFLKHVNSILKEFINDEQNWIHIDMAPRMIATDGDNLANGATGELVRTLIKLGRK